MTQQIVEKLKVEIQVGLFSEPQIVYFLAGLRKIIEQNNLSNEFPYLEFYCNWILHSVLKGSFVQKILQAFDEIHAQLLAGGKRSRESEASRISSMTFLREDIERLLNRYGINGIFQDPDDWTRFLFLYTSVIEDVPLKIRPDNTANIQEIVVSVKSNDEIIEPHRFFKVSWNLTDRDGKSGEIFYIHSYELTEA